MNILPYLFVALHLRAVEETMLCESRHKHNINSMIQATYMSSVKKVAAGLPQIGVKFLSYSNS